MNPETESDERFKPGRASGLNRVLGSGRKTADSATIQTVAILNGFKKLQASAESHLDRGKVLKKLTELPRSAESDEDLRQQHDDNSKKRLTKKNFLKLRLVEYLIKDVKEEHTYVTTLQLELLLKIVVEVHLSIQFNEESKNMLVRSDDCVNTVLDKFQVNGYLCNLAIRTIFQVIQEKHYWVLREACLDLIIRVCELSSSQEMCLLFLLQCFHCDYEYLAEAATVLHNLFSLYKAEKMNDGAQLLVERCCQLVAECDPKRTDCKIALEKCLESLVSAYGDNTLPEIAIHTIRISIGKYRSDIADFLFNICKGKEVCGLVGLIGPLILMLDDRDADVVIRAYQIFTQILSPTVACLYQFHSTDNLLSQAEKIKVGNQPLCHPEVINLIKSDINHIILCMLICYIRHAIYPKTLEALLIFNCAIIIEIRDPSLLPRIATYLLNLQEAALSILPMRSMRQSFLQWAVTHLFLLVADVYSISSLKDYVYAITNNRKMSAPFLLYPITPSPEDSIPPMCLMEKQKVSTIIGNWVELTGPTRTLHENSLSSSLSYLSDWRDFDKYL